MTASARTRWLGMRHSNRRRRQTETVRPTPLDWQPVEQMADRGKPLLDAGCCELTRSDLDPGGDMHRLDGGDRPGRPPKLTPHQKQEAIKRRDTGDETLADIARSYNVSSATISRLTP
jgi:hypothetical protein